LIAGYITSSVLRSTGTTSAMQLVGDDQRKVKWTSQLRGVARPLQSPVFKMTDLKMT